MSKSRIIKADGSTSSTPAPFSKAWGATGNRSGADLALERAKAQRRKKKQAATTAKVDGNAAAPKKAAKKQVDVQMVQCRECLKTKPESAFPGYPSRRCEDCGGQPAGTSVRTVSGGAPGLGRRR